jgi:hypothetical protein
MRGMHCHCSTCGEKKHWQSPILVPLTCRRLFLDAALLMRGQPREHLLQAWAGVLQQQGQRARWQPPTLAHSRRRAEALWAACAGATLVSCGAAKWEEAYSTWVPAGVCCQDSRAAMDADADDWLLKWLVTSVESPAV